MRPRNLDYLFFCTRETTTGLKPSISYFYKAEAYSSGLRQPPFTKFALGDNGSWEPTSAHKEMKEIGAAISEGRNTPSGACMRGW